MIRESGSSSEPVVAALRHAEARRVGTCCFADRVAALSVAHYKHHVPEWFRESQKQTCLATIVAHDNNNNNNNRNNSTAKGIHGLDTKDVLTVLAMGVGTKFLRESVLKQARNERYGERVRDCHAEVLTRRAFRRYLTEAIRRDLDATRQLPNVADIDSSILQKCILQRTEAIRYQLKPGVTLHFYCSSSPCGNSVIKKFTTLSKEVFLDHLNEHEWPVAQHEPMPGHSVPLGQFALLVKRDYNTDATVTMDDKYDLTNPVLTKRKLSKKQEKWPVNSQTGWCPAGTTTVWSNQGSLHTCSDKLARWNCLGLQGSLLSSMLVDPLYMSSLVVGRKFSAPTCRRAICCRLVNMSNNEQLNHDTANYENGPNFRMNHPTVMGTSVYMDETGFIDMTVPNQPGQDVRFYSSKSWASWLISEEHVVECIDGSIGFAVSDENSLIEQDKVLPIRIGGNQRLSQISTLALVESFLEIKRIVRQSLQPSSLSNVTDSNRFLAEVIRRVPATLPEVRRLKSSVSAQYETVKMDLLTKHPVFRDWRRREEQPQPKDSV